MSDTQAARTFERLARSCDRVSCLGPARIRVRLVLSTKVVRSRRMQHRDDSSVDDPPPPLS